MRIVRRFEKLHVEHQIVIGMTPMRMPAPPGAHSTCEVGVEDTLEGVQWQCEWQCPGLEQVWLPASQWVLYHHAGMLGVVFLSFMTSRVTR